jgi:GntR family transcriptional regulator/MocR family aminotransferase
MPKNRALLDWLQIDRGSAEPIQQQIVEQLRTAIRDARLTPGTPLPSSRHLATHLAIARGTAVAVYDRLLGEGLVHAHDRSAIFVADTADQIGRRNVDGRTAEELERDENLPPLYTTFLPGVPAFDVFPAVRWARMLSARFSQMTLDLAGEGVHIGGYPELRIALAAHLRTARGVLCEPDQVVVVSSARAAFTVLCRVLARPGERCLVEDPGYPIARRIIAASGLQPVPIPVDEDGIRVESPAPKARLAYLTPTYQMPLGVGLARYRCQILLDWAKREDAWIVEDDFDSEFRYVGKPVVALQHYDPDGRVIYIGTFSKTLFPSLRAGFMVVPRSQAKAIAAAAFLAGQEPTLHVQAALADFITQGHYAAHIRKARTVYRRRQGLLVAALNHHLEGIVAVSQPAGGMNLVLPFPPDVPALKVQSLAAEEGLHIRAMSYYAATATAPNAAHLGFAAAVDRLIEPAVARLGEVVRSLRTGPIKK